MSLQTEGEKEEKKFALPIEVLLDPCPALPMPKALISPTWSLFRALKATRVNPCHLPVREAILCKSFAQKQSNLLLSIAIIIIHINFNNYYSYQVISLGHIVYTTNENNKLYIKRKSFQVLTVTAPKRRSLQYQNNGFRFENITD